jgi:hypothetical protein
MQQNRAPLMIAIKTYAPNDELSHGEGTNPGWQELTQRTKIGMQPTSATYLRTRR